MVDPAYFKLVIIYVVGYFVSLFLMHRFISKITDPGDFDGINQFGFVSISKMYAVYSIFWPLFWMIMGSVAIWKYGILKIWEAILDISDFMEEKTKKL